MREAKKHTAIDETRLPNAQQHHSAGAPDIAHRAARSFDKRRYLGHIIGYHKLKNDLSTYKNKAEQAKQPFLRSQIPEQFQKLQHLAAASSFFFSALSFSSIIV